MLDDMFAVAARMKFRFDTIKGPITVEDLFDLPLQSNSAITRPNLDDIARSLHKQLKNDDDVSFVDNERKSDSTVQTKFDIVRAIINYKLEQRKLKDEEKNRAETKQKILEIIANKQDEGLKNKSIEELEELLKKVA